MKYAKLSRDSEDKTKIMAGNEILTIEQLENGQGSIPKKLKSIEHILDERY